jgi:hypothetical protein
MPHQDRQLTSVQAARSKQASRNTSVADNGTRDALLPWTFRRPGNEVDMRIALPLALRLLVD